MRLPLSLLILILFGLTICSAQSTISKTEKLASLSKIYGFLKYYHPEVAKGTFDWDQEFIKHLPEVLKTTDKESLSVVYIDWIDSLEEIKKCRKCDSEEVYFEKNFDLSWTQDTTIFNNKLTSQLKYIENNRIQKNHFYANYGPAGQIDITNEPVYKDFEYPSEEFRLLGLFKYWNMIEYFYPYKYLTNQKWDSVLYEMIPKFTNATNQKEYQLVIRELIAKLDDAHAWVSFNNQAPKHLPVKISHIEGKAVVSGFYNDSIALLNNLKLGDVILKIGNRDLKTETDENLKYVSASNLNGKIKDTYAKILRGSEDNVILTIERDGQLHQITENRYHFSDFDYRNKSNVIKSKLIDDGIGYINMEGIKKVSDISEVFEKFEDKKAIIIDIRNYPSPIYNAFSRYLNSEKKDFASVFKPNINYPGKFLINDNLQANYSNKAFEGKIILLVNEDSLSFSEFTIMAFQTADNVITIGNQTAGADGNVLTFNFIGGYKTAMSGLGFQYPDGTESQRKGVKIDVEVKPTIKGLRQGLDEVLEKAIEIASK